MKHIMFTIYDSKAEAYLPPFVMHQEGMAIRVFSDCVNDTKHQFGLNPQDYTLFRIGMFNDLKGRVDSGAPISLGNGLEFQKPSDQLSFSAFDDGPDLSEATPTKIKEIQNA